MGDCVKLVNNCFEFLNLCKPKDSTNNTNSASEDSSSQKLIKMSKFYTLVLPTKPKIGDEIRIKAQLKPNPRE
jgi:hypothetical protein